MSSPRAVEDAHVERSDPSSSRRWLPRQRRPVEDSKVETTSAQAVLLATAGAACVTVAAVLLLTAWAYGTATGSTDLLSRDIDPVFEVRDKLVWLVALVKSPAPGASPVLMVAGDRAPHHEGDALVSGHSGRAPAAVGAPGGPCPHRLVPVAGSVIGGGPCGRCRSSGTEAPRC